MSILNKVLEFLGYSEAEKAARKAREEAQRLEDERREYELIMRAVMYEAYNNDSKIQRLINKIRYYPKMRRAYLEPLFFAALIFLYEIAKFIDALTKLMKSAQ